MTPRERDPQEPGKRPQTTAEIRADLEAVEWRVVGILARLDKLADELAAARRAEREVTK